MKVSLITLHKIVNYGSVLQAYATQKKLEELGCEVEVVDYFTERMTQHGMSKRIKHKSPKFEKNPLLTAVARAIMYPSYKKRFSVFMKFVNENLKMTPHTYTCEEDFEKYPIEADAYCTGSDQTWNSIWNEKLDRPLYLSYADDNKPKFSYASSFGRTKLEDWEIEPTKQLLSKYDSISMRESTGVDILNSIGLDGVNVLDPTLLLNKYDWAPLVSDKYANEKYVLVYNLNRNSALDEFAHKLAQEKNLKVYFMSYQLHDFYKKGKLICCPKVGEFLGLIKHASYVVSDSFHCTAFSINFNTEFAVVYPGKFSTRLQSLLKITNLESRVAKNGSDLDVINNKIDFESVNKIIESEREKSFAWLKNSIAYKKER